MAELPTRKELERWLYETKHIGERSVTRRLVQALVLLARDTAQDCIDCEGRTGPCEDPCRYWKTRELAKVRLPEDSDG